MSNKRSMSHNACYGSVLSPRAVSKGFNLPRSRFTVSVKAHSDVSECRAYFYEYHGMYWYSLAVHGNCVWRNCNSVPFVSMCNAILDCKALLRSLKFVVDNPIAFGEIVSIDRQTRNAVEVERNNNPVTQRNH